MSTVANGDFNHHFERGNAIGAQRVAKHVINRANYFRQLLLLCFHFPTAVRAQLSPVAKCDFEHANATSAVPNCSIVLNQKPSLQTTITGEFIFQAGVRVESLYTLRVTP